ncbi:hypothetical protein HYI18_17255 [Clostridium botulinum]|uniref:Uncharacterized protein n=1 Tax=Clostridium sporogenes TaxID=1509 RepID=A0A1J1CW81_CLOSG|nr:MULTISPECIES: hypothetical protein [Clostridium]APF26774.1 hypothetical protein NPD7_40 [Clostridium sporogenes]APH16358.1 hypothetical protein NPD5_2900 [Clostridium sporogenes]MBD5640310.1 hypothetical protein [Clostridium botulinum]MDI6918843.1 hypothetical protein [Clostridium botulinum]WMU97084.1 hypothetical protein QA656_15105 [Clostridium botulinum]
MIYNEPKMYYEDGAEVKGVITNYKPPIPVLSNIKNKPIKGNTRFQKINSKNDTKIKFSLAFDIATSGKKEYKKFLIHYGDLFKFIDEWGYIYTGKIDSNIDIDMPIEADIYYIGVELLCNCEVSGF